MKVTEDTSDRFVVTSRRKLLPDLAFLLFLAIGTPVAIAMARENMADIVNVFAFFLGLLSVGIGVWGLFTNASDHVTLDAATRRLTIERRRLLRTETLSIPFSDLTDISVHEDDDMHTVAFRLHDREDILLETAFTGNRKAAPLAQRMRDWLRESSPPQGPTETDAT